MCELDFALSLQFATQEILFFFLVFTALECSLCSLGRGLSKSLLYLDVLTGAPQKSSMASGISFRHFPPSIRACAYALLTINKQTRWVNLLRSSQPLLSMSVALLAVKRELSRNNLKLVLFDLFPVL